MFEQGDILRALTTIWGDRPIEQVTTQRFRIAIQRSFWLGVSTETEPGRSRFRQAIRVQNLGFPDKKDHLNTKKNVRLDPAQNNRDKQARGQPTNILRKPKL